MSTLDLAQITEAGVDLYIIYKPYVPDYQNKMYATSNGVNYDASIWQYRGDAYSGDKGIAKKITMSAMYRDWLNVDTDHGNFDDSLYPEKPELAVTGQYVYNGQEQAAIVNGYDSETMEITGATAKNAGTYTITVTPTNRWKDGSKDVVTATWTIEKADPQVTLPTLKAKSGTSLKNIALPANFSWKDPSAKVGSQTKFAAIYTPEDGDNYNTLELTLTITLLADEPAQKEDNTTSTKPTTGTNTQQPTEPEDVEELVVEETVPVEIPTEPEAPEMSVDVPAEPEVSVPETTVPQEVPEVVPEAGDQPESVEKAESTMRTVLLIFTGVIGISAVGIILALLMRKRR